MLLTVRLRVVVVSMAPFTVQEDQALCRHAVKLGNVQQEVPWRQLPVDSPRSMFFMRLDQFIAGVQRISAF